MKDGVWARGSLGLLLALSWMGQATADDKPPLRWGADAEGGEPYVFKDPEHPNSYIGFEWELAQALAKELGRRIEFTQYDFKHLLLGLEKGDLDLVMNGFEVTPDRRVQVRFSRPYYVFKLQLVFRADEQRLKTLKDCKRIPGIKVGTLENTAAARLLDRLGIEKTTYDSTVTPYQDLELGRIDAVLQDLPIAICYAKDKKTLKFADKPVPGKGYYAIAFRKQDEALANQFDAALERLAQHGELRRIYQKWGLWNDNQEEFLPDDSFDEEDEAVAARTKTGWTFSRYFPHLRDGAILTVEITIMSMAVAILVGMPIALMRLYGPAPVRWLAVAYVEFFRGIPVLLLLYLLYYGAPALAKYFLGIDLRTDPWLVAVLGLGLNYAAYEAEIYRAAIQSIPRGQWEAAASLGMSRLLTFRRIILPQALRIILPPSTSDFVALFKDTSIVSVITLNELSKQYQMLSTAGADYLTIGEIGLVTAALYLIMSVPLGYLSRYLEQRWSKNEE